MQKIWTWKQQPLHALFRNIHRVKYTPIMRMKEKIPQRIDQCQQEF